MVSSTSDTAFNTEQFDAIYPTGVERHYWNVCRNAVIAKYLRNEAPKGAILEIGCGKGLVVAAMLELGMDIQGVELADVPVVAEAKDHVIVGKDVFDLDPRRFTAVRTVMLLDVIEHLEDPVSFIRRIRSFLPAVSCILCTVPARQELFSDHDRFNHHFRRYDRDMLRAHMDPEGARGWSASYFFHALYPAALIQLRLKGDSGRRFTVPTSFVERIVHRTLGLGFRLEHSFLPSSWRGTSIIAVAMDR